MENILSTISGASGSYLRYVWPMDNSLRSPKRSSRPQKNSNSCSIYSSVKGLEISPTKLMVSSLQEPSGCLAIFWRLNYSSVISSSSD